MPATTREQIASALWDLVSSPPAFSASSRRFVHWDQVAGTQLPFVTMLKLAEERIRQEDGTPAVKFTYHVFVYAATGDPTQVPETQMNALLDGLDQAVRATGADIGQNRQTLGGLVYWAQPRGRVFVDSGDVDGKGVAVVPFEVLTSWFV